MQVTPDSGGRQLSPPATPASAARLRVSPNQPEFGPKKPCTCPKTHVPKSKAWRHIVNFPSATPASAARLPISPYLDLIFVPPNLAKKHVCPNLAQKLMCQNLKLVKIISTGHPRLSSPAASLPKFLSAKFGPKNLCAQKLMCKQSKAWEHIVNDNFHRPPPPQQPCRFYAQIWIKKARQLAC